MKVPRTLVALSGGLALQIALLSSRGALSDVLSGQESPWIQSGAPPTPQTDDAWWDGFGTAAQQGMNADIWAPTVYDGDLVAGGRFTMAGGVRVDMIARWDGSVWHPLAGGIDHVPPPCLGPQCLGQVFALTTYRGELIAGGSFLTVNDGTPATNIARWDGSTWRALGLGVDDQVHSLTVWQDKLVAGGHFIRAGGNMVNRIATWDGVAWAPLKTGLDGLPLDLTVYDGDLIAVGTFKRAGVLTMNHIARWDGQAWHPLANGVADGSAVWVHHGELISDGLFTGTNGKLVGIGRWTGTAWEALGEQSIGASDLVTHGDFLVSGGNFPQIVPSVPGNHIARWDGSRWGPLGSGLDDPVQALVVLDGLLYVGGNFQMAGGKPSAYIARWAGPSTPVFVSDFVAHSSPERVVLTWRLSDAALLELASVIVEGAVDVAGPYVERTPPPLIPESDMEFVDDDLSSATKRWYRLVFVRHDGTRVTSHAVEALRLPGSNTTFVLSPVEISDPMIVIRYQVLAPLHDMSLRIYDVRGHLVRMLEQGFRSPGSYHVTWDRSSNVGQPMSRGVYFVQLRSGREGLTQKFIVHR